MWCLLLQVSNDDSHDCLAYYPVVLAVLELEFLFGTILPERGLSYREG